MIQMEKREKSIVSDTEKLEHLYTIRDFPIYMGVTNQDIEKDEYADMKWAIGSETGMIQLEELVPEDILYKKSHNSSYGKMWEDHHRELADLIADFRPKEVLEIGGGNGRLAKSYQNIRENIHWIIVEPSSIAPLDGVRAEYIRGFFENLLETLKELSFDVLVHSHLLEHTFDPRSFIAGCRDIMRTGQYMIFSVPSLEVQLKKKYLNAINFEHNFFLAEPYINWILENNGFKVVRKEYFSKDHSIFFVCEKEAEQRKTELSPALYQTNKKIFFEYVDYYSDLAKKLNDTISKSRINKVFLFGAHIFSQNLIAFGLNTNGIKGGVLDNDPLKQGKRLYGTKLLVSSPYILKDEEKPLVILKCGSYNDEIRQDILANINNETRFIE